MGKFIKLSAPNGKVGLVVCKSSGNVGFVNKQDAVLFIQAAIQKVERKITLDEIISFREKGDSMFDSRVKLITEAIENKICLAVEPQLGFLPQDISVIRVLVQHLLEIEVKRQLALPVQRR